MKEIRGPGYYLHDVLFRPVREFAQGREQAGCLSGTRVDRLDKGNLLRDEQSREEQGDVLDASSEQHGGR